MPADFANRLDPKRYADDDVEFQVRLVPDPRDERAEALEAWISERLVDRMRYLALAYELPLMSRLPTQDEWSYPEVQCASLEDELVFMLNLVSDPALARAVEPLMKMIRLAIRQPRGRTLVVEAP